jgi:hypothetical protein
MAGDRAGAGRYRQPLYRLYRAAGGDPAICGVIGASVVGVMGDRTGFGVALGLAITRYVLALVAAYVVAVIASKLAPAFGGRESIVQGLKLIAYSATASWIGGVFGLIPVLSFVAIVFSLYSLYLLFIGAAAVMSVPESRAVGYAAAVIVVTIAVYVAVALVGERIISMM